MLFTKDKDLDWNWTRIKVAFSSSPFFDEYFWTSSFFDFFIPFGDFSAGNGADWIEEQLRYPRDTTAICSCTPGHRAFRTEFREGWMIFSLVYFRKRSNCSRWLLEIIIKSYNWILQHGGKMIMYIFMSGCSGVLQFVFQILLRPLQTFLPRYLFSDKLFL